MLFVKWSFIDILGFNFVLIFWTKPDSSCGFVVSLL